jgi:hypothetical protein
VFRSRFTRAALAALSLAVCSPAARADYTWRGDDGSRNTLTEHSDGTSTIRSTNVPGESPDTIRVTEYDKTNRTVKITFWYCPPKDGKIRKVILPTPPPASPPPDPQDQGQGQGQGQDKDKDQGKGQDKDQGKGQDKDKDPPLPSPPPGYRYWLPGETHGRNEKYAKVGQGNRKARAGGTGKAPGRKHGPGRAGVGLPAPAKGPTKLGQWGKPVVLPWKR